MEKILFWVWQRRDLALLLLWAPTDCLRPGGFEMIGPCVSIW